MFDRHKRARLFTLLFPPLILALVILLHQTGLERQGWLLAIAGATRGVVSPILIVCIVALGVMLAVILLAGNVDPDDIGLDRDHLGRGVGITVMTWAAVQVIGVLPRVVAEDPVAIHRDWLRDSPFVTAGTLLTALGLAAIAEIALRGFLLVQLYLRFHRDARNPYQGVAPAVALTVLAGNLIALLTSMPVAASRALLISQAIAAGIGLYLSWIFLRTRNLFFTIGVHTLIVAPTPVVAGLRGEPGWFFPVVVAVVASVWVLLWPRRE